MPVFDLYRHDITLYKDFGAGDKRQIPAAGTAAIYFRGARISADGGPAGAGAVVSVNNPGTLGKPFAPVVGDTIQLGTSASLTGTVVDITATTVTVNWNQSTSWTAGNRLMIQSRRPVAYTDPQGNVSLGSSLTTDSTTGSARFYTRPRDIDVIATVSGVSTIFDDVGGAGETSDFDPLDFGLMADDSTDDYGALARALYFAYRMGRGKVTLPPGIIRIGTALSLNLNTETVLEGSGRGVTELKAIGGAINLIVVSGVNDITIQDMTCSRTVASGAGTQLLWTIASTRCTFKTLHLKNGAVGIYDGGSTDTMIDDIVCSGSDWETFVELDGSIRPHVRSVRGRYSNILPAANGAINIHSGASGVKLLNVDVGPASLASHAGKGLLIEPGGGASPTDVNVTACRFSGGNKAGDKQPAIMLSSGKGIAFIGCHVEDSDDGWWIMASAVAGVHITGCTSLGMQQQAIDIDAGTHISIADFISSHVDEGAAGAMAHIDIAGTVSNVMIDGLLVGNILRAGGLSAFAAVTIQDGAGTNISVMNARGTNVTGTFVNNQKSNANGAGIYLAHNPSSSYSISTLHNAFGTTLRNYADNDTTPSVANAGYLSLSYGAGIIVTKFDDGAIGQWLLVHNLGGNTITLQNDATKAVANAIFSPSGDRVLGLLDVALYHCVPGVAGFPLWLEVVFQVL